MFEWHKKERPFLGIAGFGGGVSSKLVRGRGRFSITGGNVNALEPGNGWTYHTFTSPGNLTVSGIFTIEVLVVGGGGGGGADVGGGGGAGGVAHNSSIIIGPGTYPVTVGSAGTGGIGPNPSSVCGTSGRTGFNGGPSTFNGITALGGGGAGGWSGCPGVLVDLVEEQLLMYPETQMEQHLNHHNLNQQEQLIMEILEEIVQIILQMEMNIQVHREVEVPVLLVVMDLLQVLVEVE